MAVAKHPVPNGRNSGSNWEHGVDALRKLSKVSVRSRYQDAKKSVIFTSTLGLL